MPSILLQGALPTSLSLDVLDVLKFSQVAIIDEKCSKCIINALKVQAEPCSLGCNNHVQRRHKIIADVVVRQPMAGERRRERENEREREKERERERERKRKREREREIRRERERERGRGKEKECV